MDPLRFRPQLEEIEGRLTPSVTPEQVFNAAGLANFYFEGTRGALLDQSFIRITANQAPTQALAAVIVAQSPGLADTLSQYVVQLRTEAAANPAAADFFAEQIALYSDLANKATVAGAQAQAVSARIDTIRATASSRTTGTTGTTGTNLGSFGGVNGIGTGTATNNTLPSTGTGTGTTGPATGGSSGTGTGSTTGSSGTGSGTGTGSTPGTTTGSTPGTTTGSDTDTTPIGGT